MLGGIRYVDGSSLLLHDLCAILSSQFLRLSANTRFERCLTSFLALLLVKDLFEPHLLIHQLFVLIKECKVVINAIYFGFIADLENTFICHYTELELLD